MTAEEARRGSIVLLAKQPGKTSFESLYQVKRALGTRKVGHTGTLDSFATGLLVVCAGPLTRLVPYITEADKTYEAVIKFGAETDTLECTGNKIKSAPLPTKDAVVQAVNKYTGRIVQVPPQYSAIHVAGKRASDIVRKGEEAAIPPREVTVYSSKIDGMTYSDDGRGQVLVSAICATFTVSKGTYIRSLARDIGRDAGSAAFLAALCRTRVGAFKLEDAAANEDEILSHSMPMTQDVAKMCGFAAVTMDGDAATDVMHGRNIARVRCAVGEGMTALFDVKGCFLSLCEVLNGHFSYKLVMPAYAPSITK